MGGGGEAVAAQARSNRRHVSGCIPVGRMLLVIVATLTKTVNLIIVVLPPDGAGRGSDVDSLTITGCPLCLLKVVSRLLLLYSVSRLFRVT